MKPEFGQLDPDIVRETRSLEAELAVLPPPPSDLPMPWNSERWVRWYVLGFFVTLFGLYFLGRWLDIAVFADFGGACASSWGIFLMLGILLFSKFHRRGYATHYSNSANRLLAQAIKRYRRPKTQEALFWLFPQYLIDGEDYYLIWYVPGIGINVTRTLAKGAEPVLFNRKGEWLDDEELFNKVMLMWSYGLNISPGTIQRKLPRDRDGLRKLGHKYLPSLPRLLELNKQIFDERGLEFETSLVRDAFPAKLAFYLNSIDFLDKKCQWADAYGWDSVTQLRYKDFLEYHEANVNVTSSRQRFRDRNKIDEAENAARRILQVLSARREIFRGWKKRKKLIDALDIIQVSIPSAEIYFQKVDGSWQAPEVFVEAYRSRLDFLRRVDAGLREKEEAKKLD